MHHRHVEMMSSSRHLNMYGGDTTFLAGRRPSDCAVVPQERAVRVLTLFWRGEEARGRRGTLQHRHHHQGEGVSLQVSTSTLRDLVTGVASVFASRSALNFLFVRPQDFT